MTFLYAGLELSHSLLSCVGPEVSRYCDVYRCACTSELHLNSLSLLYCAGPKLSHSMLSYTLDLSCLTPSSPVLDLRSLTPFSTSLVLCSLNHSPSALDLISYDILHGALAHAHPTMHCIPYFQDDAQLEIDSSSNCGATLATHSSTRP